MPVVPFSPQDARAPVLPPLYQHYLLMAAAQMHDEGRLIKPDSEPQIPMTVQENNPLAGPTKLPGHEEWERQGQSDVNMSGEPAQHDITPEILRKLGTFKPKGAREI